MTWKSLSSHREHGGDIDVARQRFGRADMIDLSTGISPLSYPAPPLAAKRLQNWRPVLLRRHYLGGGKIRAPILTPCRPACGRALPRSANGYHHLPFPAGPLRGCNGTLV